MVITIGVRSGHVLAAAIPLMIVVLTQDAIMDLVRRIQLMAISAPVASSVTMAALPLAIPPPARPKLLPIRALVVSGLVILTITLAKDPLQRPAIAVAAGLVKGRRTMEKKKILAATNAPTLPVIPHGHR